MDGGECYWLIFVKFRDRPEPINEGYWIGTRKYDAWVGARKYLKDGESDQKVFYVIRSEQNMF